MDKPNECVACGYQDNRGNVQECEDGITLCAECAEGKTCPHCGVYHEDALLVGDWDLDGKIRCISCYTIPETYRGKATLEEK